MPYSTNFCWNKTLANSCLFAFLYMLQDIVRIWVVKFGKPPVICRIHQGFPSPKICAISYVLITHIHHDTYDKQLY